MTVGAFATALQNDDQNPDWAQNTFIIIGTARILLFVLFVVFVLLSQKQKCRQGESIQSHTVIVSWFDGLNALNVDLQVVSKLRKINKINKFIFF